MSSVAKLSFGSIELCFGISKNYLSVPKQDAVTTGKSTLSLDREIESADTGTKTVKEVIDLGKHVTENYVDNQEKIKQLNWTANKLIAENNELEAELPKEVFQSIEKRMKNIFSEDAQLIQFFDPASGKLLSFYGCPGIDWPLGEDPVQIKCRNCLDREQREKNLMKKHNLFANMANLNDVADISNDLIKTYSEQNVQIEHLTRHVDRLTSYNVLLKEVLPETSIKSMAAEENDFSS